MEFFQTNQTLLLGAALASVILLVVGAVVTPLMLSRVPADWLTREPPSERDGFGWFLWGFRNLVGGVLMVAGVAMLFLPGQGILTIAAGFALTDLPGKRRILIGLLHQPALRRPLQALRRRRGQPPLEIPT